MCCTGGACMILGGCGAGGGGYCSECVGTAACNPTLCGTCISGTCAPVTEVVTPGSDTGICGNPCITPCLIPNCQIPDNGITNLSNPCNPCSPTQCGTTTQAPLPYCNPDSINAPNGGGSGAGTAGNSGGGSSAGSKGGGAGGASACTSKLSQALNRFGATLASLFSGGKKVPASAIVPGQPAAKSKNPISSNTFLLVIIVVSALLLMITFGHAPEGD